MDAERRPVCWKNIFSAIEPMCPNPPVWRSTAPGTREMTWCNEHAPHPEYRERLSESESSR